MSISYEVLKTVHQRLFEQVQKQFDQAQKLKPSLLIMDVSDDGELGAVYACEDKLLGLFLGSGDAGKDYLAAFLKNMLTPTKAQAAFAEQFGFTPRLMVLICEAWVSRPKNNDELQEVLTGKRPRPAEDPNRQEAVLITLNSAHGSVTCYHLIEDKPERRLVAGDFPRPEDVPMTSGRLTMQDILGPQGPVH